MLESVLVRISSGFSGGGHGGRGPLDGSISLLVVVTDPPRLVARAIRVGGRLPRTKRARDVRRLERVRGARRSKHAATRRKHRTRLRDGTNHIRRSLEYAGAVKRDFQKDALQRLLLHARSGAAGQKPLQKPRGAAKGQC